jgi:hypothetical protein
MFRKVEPSTKGSCRQKQKRHKMVRSGPERERSISPFFAAVWFRGNLRRFREEAVYDYTPTLPRFSAVQALAVFHVQVSQLWEGKRNLFR